MTDAKCNKTFVSIKGGDSRERLPDTQPQTSYSPNPNLTSQLQFYLEVPRHQVVANLPASWISLSSPLSPSKSRTRSGQQQPTTRQTHSYHASTPSPPTAKPEPFQASTQISDTAPNPFISKSNSRSPLAATHCPCSSPPVVNHVMLSRSCTRYGKRRTEME